jgi:Ca2+/Na+ antiporter
MQHSSTFLILLMGFFKFEYKAALSNILTSNVLEFLVFAFFSYFIYDTLIIWREFIIITPYMCTVLLTKFTPFIILLFPLTL